MVDPAGDGISHIVDVNPRKTGWFVPGSGQKIVEPNALRELGPFLRRIDETEKSCPKVLKPLSKLILDFGLAKGKSAVEFQEGS
jgi:hypothetical protein